jgi:hypothetical protein|tara:strand:- start:102 stop:440 length:339 start_codon:yes stop_codon:yes gene_type:complete
MASRYENRRPFRNGNEIYFNILEERGVSSVVQFTTPVFNKVTQQNRRRISQIQKIWTVGDRLYKLAAEHYGDPKLWWVIARFNYKPTEAHFKQGDIIYIPMPIETMLEYYRN